MTGDRRFLTLDASNGKPLAERPVPVREGIAGESLLGAACSPDGATQAYSVDFKSSRLYLGRKCFMKRRRPCHLRTRIGWLASRLEACGWEGSA